MKPLMPLTGPHAFGLVSAPLLDRNASNSGVKLLAIEKSQPTSRRPSAAFLALALIVAAVSFAAVPVSYAIHRHLHP